jgi:uncharacterized protein DUF4157
MSHELHGRGRGGHHGSASPGAAVQRSGAPGKQTLVEQIPMPAVQRRVNGAEAASTGDTASAVHATAARGVATSASPLPFSDAIQRAFGRHDVSSIQAHVGPDAAASAGAMGADAYATGNHVVLGDRSDLHTAAHEAAHVVQQRGGVQLSGGVGTSGDVYERHADAVADAVVAGGSAEPLLDRLAPGPGHGGEGGGAVQQKVKRGRMGSRYVWYSDLDPNTQFEFKDKHLAIAHDEELQRRADRDARRRGDRDAEPALETRTPAVETRTEDHSDQMAVEDDHAASTAAPPGPTAGPSNAALESVRAMILRCLPARVGADHAARALVIDWTPQEIQAAEGLEYLTELDVASCFDTARRLFDLLGDPATTQGNWQTEVKAGVGIPQLVADIQAHAQNAVLYRVGMNRVAHGFTIVLRSGSAEVIQGFAGPSGESLAKNIDRGGSHTIAETCGLLSDLLDGGKAFKAQNELFDGSIDIEKIPSKDATQLGNARGNDALTEAHKSEQTDKGYRLFYRDLSEDIFQLERRALFPPQELEQRVQAKIRDGLAALEAKAKGKGAANQGDRRTRQRR